jgi:hypothetical protein
VSNRNALRDGLAAISRHHPAFSSEIERLADAFCNGDTDPLLREQARITAENEYTLMCVRAECVARIERMRDPSALPFSDINASFARARARIRQAELTYAQLVKAKARAAEATNGAVNDGPSQATRQPEPRALRQECEAIFLALPDFERLERYERRAWSRRRRAMDQFIAIKCLRDFHASRS